ncbi:MAG: TlpA disulfide reductase family protein [Mariprofundaceae bacterium]|nr:TlpA disulfide reductase family protein [Mariprofundaceae bacterium]
MIQVIRISALLAVLLFFIPPAHAVQYEWYDGKGVAHSLRDFSGKPVILHFWASWCAPCRKELPELAVWRAQHPNAPFAAISLDQNLADARNYLSQQHLPFPPLVGNMNSAMQLGVRGLPTTIVIGEDGKIRQRLLGAQSWENAEFSRKILSKVTP